MKLKLTLLLLLAPPFAFAQDLTYARRMVDTLTAPTFWGRGYTKNGMAKAAAYLAAELKTAGLQPLAGKSYFQEFSYPVNTFPGKMEVAVDGTTLEPGRDFILSPDSRGVKSQGRLRRQDGTHFVAGNYNNRLVVILEDKLTWSVAPAAVDFTTIQINRKAITGVPADIRVNIENKFIPDFKAANVAGLVRGTAQPDSFLVFTAHYDHLGGLGANTYFPGANDNASGVALLLTLARHYARNPARHSVVFLFFAGEEAGLLGSKYFTEHPLLPLPRIRFLVNLDLAGTGEEGITVVNATEFKPAFTRLQEINARRQLLAQVKPRGQAANSDHHWFTQKGVPAFFIYTLGGIKAYHDVHDRASTLPLTEYEDLFRLLVAFFES